MKIMKRLAALAAALFVGLSVLMASPATAAQPATPTTAAASLTGAGAVAAIGSRILPMEAGEGHVSIPARYVYNPNTTYQRTLHDYCTKSPDAFGSADFRGPCARHDLCIMDRDVSRATCDSRFLSNLRQECNHAYDRWWESGTRATCNATAYTYYGVVRASTWF
ncbi:hypothetical protein B5M43_012945 [Microbacterium sp. MEC084]|nr:hypothetical protein [Microbacterium sp. MEC084]